MTGLVTRPVTGLVQRLFRRVAPVTALMIASIIAPGAAFGAALAAASMATPAPAQQGETTLRVQVRLVSLFVSVTDARGAPVPDLEKNNFLLSENGAPEPIAVFEKQTDVPLSVVLAIDTSGSTRKDQGVEQRAAHDFAQALLPPGPQGAHRDQFALFDFNSDVREVVPFTDNVRRIDGGLGSLTRGPATAFYAAVLLGAQTLAPRSGRKVLVVVSDGDNTIAGTTFDEALAAAQRGDTMIYSLIDTPIQADAGRDTAGEHAMITLSEETGGRAFYVNEGGLAAAFRKVADDLRTQYLLGYYPVHGQRADVLAGPGGFRTLHVVLRNLRPGLDATAHYRSGYYRPAAQP